MNLISCIYILLITSILPHKEKAPRKLDICNIYGNIYIERENRNAADTFVYVEPEENINDLKVFLQENEFFADRPGMWHLVTERHLADFVVFIETEKDRAKYRIYYTDTEAYAGCR